MGLLRQRLNSVLDLELPDLARPDLAFIAIWSLVLAAYLPITTSLNPDLQSKTIAMLAFNLASAPLAFWAMKRITLERGRAGSSSRALGGLSVAFLGRFAGILIVLWAAIEIASILYSGGLPLVWSLTGDPRGYQYFGIPTITGLGNTLRSFAGMICIFLLLKTGRRVYFVVWAALLATIAAEITRSGVFVYIVESLAVFLVLRPLRLRALLILIGGALVMATLFVVLGQLRGIVMSAERFEGTAAYFGETPAALFWLWAYLVTPLANVNLAAIMDSAPVHFPYWTLQPLVPGMVRSLFFVPGATPITLVEESLTATSAYGPLVGDFGFLGAAILIAAFQVFAAYSYLRARYFQDLFHVFLYPALFMSIVLSIFSLFLLSLGTLAFPLICYWLRRYLNRKRSERFVPVALPGASTV